MLRVYYLKVSDYDAVPDGRLAEQAGEETRGAAVLFRSRLVRRLKWLGEGMVRGILEEEWRIRRESYRISRAEHGKPYLEGVPFPVFYNLSHSGDYIVCGFSDREVGIDIQQVGRCRMDVARRFFHPHEIRQLEQCAEEMRCDLFFRYWSAKESFLKYTGTGLSASLSGFEVLFEGGEVRILAPDFPQDFYMKACLLDKDYRCFVCSECPEAPAVIPFAFAGP